MDHRKREDDKARKRHGGVGREGLQPGEAVEPTGNEQGLGHEGVKPEGSRQERKAETLPAGDFLDKIPQWLKSLHNMENELRSAARKGLILRKEEASEHLAEARRHLQAALNEARGIEPPNGPQTPLRKEGEV